MPPDFVVKSQGVDIATVILPRSERPLIVQRLGSHRTSRCERLSPLRPIGCPLNPMACGNDTCANCAAIPLVTVGMAVIVDPTRVDDWAFPGWDGGDMGHPWLSTACKQAQSCPYRLPGGGSW